MASEIVTEDQIRTAAYYIWLAEGQPMGNDEAHWHRARSVLEASVSVKSEPASNAGRTQAGKKAAAPTAKTTRKTTAPKAGANTKTRQKA
jgi:hypothetical protein